MSNERPVIVLLLPWWLSKSRSVEKYVDLYRSNPRVSEVIVHAGTTAELLGIKQNQATQKILKKLRTTSNALRRMSGHNPIVIIQSMSNMGGTVLAGSLQKLREDESFDVKGVVLDSCPGDLTFETFIRAFLASQKKINTSAAVGSLLASVILLLPSKFALRVAVILIFASMYYFEKRLSDGYHRSIIESSREIPKLFLYSLSDPLVSFRTIENVASVMEMNGDLVMRQRFENTPHVGHLGKETAVYNSTVQTFLDKVTSHDA